MFAVTGIYWVCIYLSNATGLVRFLNVGKTATRPPASRKSAISWATLNQDQRLCGDLLGMHLPLRHHWTHLICRHFEDALPGHWFHKFVNSPGHFARTPMPSRSYIRNVCIFHFVSSPPTLTRFRRSSPLARVVENGEFFAILSTRTCIVSGTYQTCMCLRFLNRSAQFDAVLMTHVSSPGFRKSKIVHNTLHI